MPVQYQAILTSMVSELEKAWLAGAIDCDGHVGRHWQKPNPKRRERKGRWKIVVCLTGTILAIPEKANKLYPASLHYRKTPVGNKPSAMWTVSQHKAFEVLCDIYPYLVGKQELAKDIMDKYMENEANKKRETYAR